MIENKVTILEDRGDWLAVLKPEGWLTIPGRGNKENTPVLSHVVGAQLRGGAARQGRDLFVVHRLDEGTSGVVLFARTPEAHKYLSGLFESREMKKTYWCLVKGNPGNQMIDLPLFKLPSKKNKSVVDPKGKSSQTQIMTKASQDGFSLVEARPLTGRSHQIRVHLAHVGFPLLGDKLYGGLTQALGLEFKYPLLLAREIEFRMRDQTIRVTAPLGGTFLEAAKALGFAPSCSVQDRS